MYGNECRWWIGHGYMLGAYWVPANGHKSHCEKCHVISVPWIETLSSKGIKKEIQNHGCTYSKLLIWGLNSPSLDGRVCPISSASGMAKRFQRFQLTCQCWVIDGADWSVGWESFCMHVWDQSGVSALVYLWYCMGSWNFSMLALVSAGQLCGTHLNYWRNEKKKGSSAECIFRESFLKKLRAKPALIDG